MELSSKDTRFQFISQADDNSPPSKPRGFTVPSSPKRESNISRSRLNSRVTYRHYTTSVYSELHRAQSQTSDDAKHDNISIPPLEAVEEIKITKQIKRINNNEIQVLFTLRDSFNSREAFETLTWRQDSDNAFCFSSEDQESFRDHTQANFAHIVKENAKDFTSADIYYENKRVKENLGSVRRYAEQDAEDIIVSDKNGNGLYKLAEDTKPTSGIISCLMMDLQGNKMSSAEIDFHEDDQVTNCRATFPPDTNSKQKLMILAALVFKMVQLDVVEQWHPKERTPRKETSSSLFSFFYCFFSNNK